ncbi:MAG: hypothetical protein WC421_03835 [Elusimicrobiales bacterium]
MKKLAIAAVLAVFACAARAEDAAPANRVQLICDGETYSVAGVINRDSGMLKLFERNPRSGEMREMGLYPCTRTSSQKALVFRSEKKHSTEFVIGLPATLFDGNTSAPASIQVRADTITYGDSMTCRVNPF